ncbi:hypothetical protein [Klebsiella phage phiKp_22]|jgi:hypothetical protein|nr:hypothetical protein [Klebsiella phage phiKp_22]
MNYSKNRVYCISPETYRRWKDAKNTINYLIATVVGVQGWTPLELDSLGRVVKIKTETGKIISAKTIGDEYDRSLSCLFSSHELEEGKVVQIGAFENQSTTDRYVVFEVSAAIKPAPVVKDGRSIFTLEEAKEIILEWTGIVPETTKYELFKTCGLAEVKTVKTVEVKNV